MDLIDQLQRDDDAGEGRVGYPVIGVVTNDNDPDRLGRVRARWGGMPDGTESNWLRPLYPGYIESYPKVNDPLLVLFAYGDTSSGFYLYFPTKATTARPSEAMLLGTMFVGMYNDMIAKQNALRAALFQAVTGLQSVFNLHTHNYNPGAGAPIPSMAPATTWNAADPGDAAKVKAANGSVPAANSRSEIVLSSRANVKG